MVLAGLAALGLLLVAPLWLAPFHVRVVQLIFLGAGLALAWTILGGFAGYFSFGHMAFVGMGAFAAALFEAHLPLGGPVPTFIAALIFAVAVTGLFALAIAYPILRLRGIYFAIAMLGASLVLTELSSGIGFFQGALGMVLPGIEPRALRTETFYYYAFLLAGLVVLAVAFAIRRSALGYGLVSIREDEDTARMLGVPTERYKIRVFVVSAMLTAVFGVLYAHSLGYITTDSVFRIDFSLNMIVYSMLGGLGTLAGPIIGATVMVVLTQVVLGHLLEIHMLVTGAVVVALMLLAPGGILGFVGDLFHRRPAAADGERPAAPPATAGEPAPPVAPDAAPILRLRGLTVRFRGLVAVNGVDLEVPEGSICSLIGPNGAGKSTIFNAVTGYVSPSAGAIEYRGARIDGLDTARVSERGIARAFQIAKPFAQMPVFDNVLVGALFGKAGARDARAVAEEALHLTGLDPLRDALASTLTVGNLRRLELARAIATRPDLLLADEPCAGLNATETEQVLEILREVRRRGVTVLLVEHDMAAVMRVSDRIFVLDAGAKIAEGPPEAVTRDPRVIEAYLGEPIPDARASTAAVAPGGA
ncbi:MAG TPA: branched-chain amino acid ABC transporter ATP-binding protein/permease [Geminicoccaceae bacterium]|nr:branched-chain amino acid ABC transporter ATP-binding protein/permease [Geminicoccaceae bacterium]